MLAVLDLEIINLNFHEWVAQLLSLTRNQNLKLRFLVMALYDA